MSSNREAALQISGRSEIQEVIAFVIIVTHHGESPRSQQFHVSSLNSEEELSRNSSLGSSFPREFVPTLPGMADRADAARYFSACFKSLIFVRLKKVMTNARARAHAVVVVVVAIIINEIIIGNEEKNNVENRREPVELNALI